jgi:hypothetical protein
MRLAEWHDAVQALGPDGQDKPLGKRVQIRTPRGQQEWLHAAVSQQAPKRGGIERIPVQNEVLHAAEEAVARPDARLISVRRSLIVLGRSSSETLARSIFAATSLLGELLVMDARVRHLQRAQRRCHRDHHRRRSADEDLTILHIGNEPREHRSVDAAAFVRASGVG